MKLPIALTISLALGAGGPALRAQTAEEEAMSLWDYSVNLRGALGYKDNLLLSRVTEETSAFWQTSADFFLFRFGDTPWSLSFFASGEDRRYFSGEVVDKEQLFLAHLTVGRKFGETWEAGTELEYFYLDQVVDVSATENIFQSLPVRSHTVGVAPFLTRELPGESQLKLEAQVVRQYYNDPLDDYWEMGPELSFEKEYGHGSEVSLSYAFRERRYDSREQLGLDFFTLPGTELKFRQHETELTISHHWDEEERWQSRLRLGHELNRDNGPGFFDYHKYRVAKRLRYVRETWEAWVEAEMLLYNYTDQPVIEGEGERERKEYGISVRVQKELLENLLLFLESDHEWSRSNIKLDEYQVNTVMSGVDWEF